MKPSPDDPRHIWESTVRDSSDLAWRPTSEYVANSRLWAFMQQHSIRRFSDLLERSTSDPEWFWEAVTHDLDITWQRPYTRVLDMSGGPEWPQWFIEGQYNHVYDAVDKRALMRPTELALLWEGEDGDARSLTYGELRDEVCKAANALHSIGIKRGDRVGIFMPMLPETAIAVLAVSRIGAIYTPIFSGYGAPAVAGRLAACSATLLITADGFLRNGKPVHMKQIADEAAAEVPGLKHVLVVKRLGEQVEWREGRDVWWHEIVPGQSSDCPVAVTPADDPYMIIYTSGTTGAPKGIVHVQSGFPLKAAQELAHCFDLHAGDRLFWVSDMGWMMGPWAITGSLILGAACFLYEGSISYPRPDRVWSLVERHGLTHLGISPTAVRSLMTHGEEPVRSHDLTSLRILAGAGEPWNPEPWRWLFDVVGEGKLPLINYSGGTEVSGGILACNPLLPMKPCGFSAPVPGMAADVIDEAGRPVRGSVGELALRSQGPGIARGFWRDPQRYVDTYWSRVPGTWVHGDWAMVDDDGFWHILGRSDDTIKVAGKRVGPAEVEAAAMSHPAVAEAAAVGVPDPTKGESLVVFVVLRGGHEPGENLRHGIEEAIVKHIGKSLKPQAVKFARELPHTRNGKILRRLVRRAYMGEAPGDLSSLENASGLEAITSAL